MWQFQIVFVFQTVKTFTCIKLKHLQPFIFCDAPNLLRTRLPSKVVFLKTNIYMYKLSSQKTSVFKQHALVKLKWPHLNNGSWGHRFILMPVSSFWLEVLKHWHFQGCKTVHVNAFSSWKITFETYCLHLKTAQRKKGFERNKIDQRFHYTEKSSIHLLNFVFGGELSPLYINIYIFGMKQWL